MKHEFIMGDVVVHIPTGMLGECMGFGDCDSILEAVTFDGEEYINVPTKELEWLGSNVED